MTQREWQVLSHAAFLFSNVKCFGEVIKCPTRSETTRYLIADSELDLVNRLFAIYETKNTVWEDSSAIFFVFKTLET